MTEVIEVLALNQAKTKLKLETLKHSKFDQTIVVEHLESLYNDYTLAIEILSRYHNDSKKSHTETITI